MQINGSRDITLLMKENGIDCCSLEAIRVHFDLANAGTYFKQPQINAFHLYVILNYEGGMVKANTF
jgi:hypothetical protein